MLVGLGALVLVGVFATELANESWDLVQQEIKADKLRAVEAGEDETAADADDSAGGGMLGPVNTTAIGASAASLVPQALRTELDESWHTLSAFCDAQWLPTLRHAMAVRRVQTAEQERLDAIVSAVQNGTRPFSDSLGPLFSAPPSLPEYKPTAEELSARAEIAEWSLRGAPLRQWIGATVFSFALAATAKRQWDEYPITLDDLEALAPPEGRGTKAGASVAGGDAAGDTSPQQQTLVATATAAKVAARSAMLAAEEVAQARAAIAQRRAEIDARQAAIDARLASMAQDEAAGVGDAIVRRLEEIDAQRAAIDERLAQMQSQEEGA